MGLKVNVKVNKNLLPSVEQLNSQVKKATEKEFRQTAQRLFGIVNKRINRLQSANVVSPALTALDKKRNGNLHFSTRYSFDDLKKEYAQAYAFYKTETGTVGGAKAFTERLKDKIGDRINDKDYINAVFDTLHATSERIPNAIFKGMVGTNDILQQIIENEEIEERSLMDMTEQEREDFITAQVLQIAKEIQEKLDKAVDDIGNAIENAYNNLW